MTFLTAQAYIDKIKRDLDLESEDFVTQVEFLGYINQAINRAEQLILGIHEDYFLNFGTVDLTTGQNACTIPSDMFAHKIRRLLYSNGTDKYEVKRIKNIGEINDIDVNDQYRYIIRNDLTAGPKIQIYPVARETSSNITCFYIRNARTITLATDLVDIPEAQNFILAYMALMVWVKEGHPNVTIGEGSLAKEEQELVTTLTAMIPDEDNFIELDTRYLDGMDF